MLMPLLTACSKKNNQNNT